MEISSIFLIIALFVLTSLFISRPLFIKDEVNPATAKDILDHERSTLLTERERILSALQELDLDEAMGKIPEGVYPDQRDLLIKEGVDVFRRLDSLQFGEVKGNHNGLLDSLKENLLTVQEQSQNQGLPNPELSATALEGNFSNEGIEADPTTEIILPNDELEIMIANRRRNQKEKSAGFCTNCGGSLRISDRYCYKCGSKVSW